MNFRAIYISHMCTLHYKNNNLMVKNDDGETLIPLSDISVVLIESLQTTITSKLLSSLAEYKITMIICDESHMPQGILLPLNGRVRMLESYKYQSNATTHFKNKVWTKIVKNKIYNQSVVLQNAHMEHAKSLLSMVDDVMHGDKENREAKAAHLYWRSIFCDSFSYFTRGLLDVRNAALNYGYAILRSIIANNLTSKGFILYDGLHHCSELNQFNLVDDIIEPFRAFVDLEVYEIFENEGCKKTMLDNVLKKRLIGIVENVAYINNQKFSIINAIGKYCDNIYNCYKDNDDGYLTDVYIDTWS